MIDQKLVKIQYQID